MAAELCRGCHVQEVGAPQAVDRCLVQLAEALAVRRLLAQHRRQLADPIEQVCDFEPFYQRFCAHAVRWSSASGPVSAVC